MAPIENPPAHFSIVPRSPLFDDPLWHGAADPTLIWNSQERQWVMYYTQRRATLFPANGVDWAHGTAIGMAKSADGTSWTYTGVCQGDDSLGEPVKAGYSWWAPSVFCANSTYHLYVTCVEGGLHSDWGGASRIKHFTSTDGAIWKLAPPIQLSSERCIDPCLAEIQGTYYMWYKDERHHSHIWWASSHDLNRWKVEGEAVGDTEQEAPLVWHWHDRFWLITDAWKGLRIYSSPSGKPPWIYNTTILADPGNRFQDNARGAHPFVQVDGDRAYVIYFVHYLPADPLYETRRTVIQAAELILDPRGMVTCNRDR